MQVTGLYGTVLYAAAQKPCVPPKSPGLRQIHSFIRYHDLCALGGGSSSGRVGILPGSADPDAVPKTLCWPLGAIFRLLNLVSDSRFPALILSTTL